MPAVAELAWAAGLIDGEGCIAIIRTEAKVFGHRTVSPRHRLILKVTMCDQRPIKELVRIFRVGGTSTRAAGMRTSASYTWLCNLTDAVFVLRQVRPYFILKGEETDLAFQFAALPFKANGRSTVPLKEIQKREQLFKKMRALKTRSRFLRKPDHKNKKRS